MRATVSAESPSNSPFCFVALSPRMASFAKRFGFAVNTTPENVAKIRQKLKIEARKNKYQQFVRQCAENSESRTERVQNV